MSHQRDSWPPLLVYDPVQGAYLLPPVPNTRSSSPQRICYCDGVVQELHEIFNVRLNVAKYKPEEIVLKKETIKNVPYLTVEAKKEVNGVVRSECAHRYPLPEGVTAQDLVKDLSPTGILTVKASKWITTGTSRRGVSPSRARQESS